MHTSPKDSMTHEGLLTGSQGGGRQFQWPARLLYYIGTVFLDAWANATLVGIASGAHLSFPAIGHWEHRPTWCAASIATIFDNPIMDPSQKASPRTSKRRCCCGI